MASLTHATLGAPHMDAEKRKLDSIIQFEIKEAKRIQKELDCSWAEALEYACTGYALSPKEES